jgi:hypothetical protein
VKRITRRNSPVNLYLQELGLFEMSSVQTGYLPQTY